MRVILSCTDDPKYSFYIPIVTWAWSMIGVDYFLFVPKEWSETFKVALKHRKSIGHLYELDYDKKREASYFQCARLFAAAHDAIDSSEVLITSDIDMVCFAPLPRFDRRFTLIGTDLTEQSQYAMCYAIGTKDQWCHAMNINGETIEQKTGELLDHEPTSDSFRSDFWCRDQEYLKKNIDASGIETLKIERRISDTQRTAKNRADRDGWNVVGGEIWDSHLPRPFYTPESFKKGFDLLQSQYPNENLDWMTEYRNEFVKLL